MLGTVLGAEDTFLYKTDKVRALKELAFQLKERKTLNKISKMHGILVCNKRSSKALPGCYSNGGEICKVGHSSSGSWHSSRDRYVNTIIIQCCLSESDSRVCSEC